jgi:hypothetical protein
MGSHTAFHSDMPLMRWAPQSAEISDGGHAPDLLVVGLEEVLVEAPAVVGGDVALEGGDWSFGGRTRTHRYDRTQRTASMDPRFFRALTGLDRVVVELALVVDAAHAGPQHEVLVGEDLVPQASTGAPW